MMWENQISEAVFCGCCCCWRGCCPNEGKAPNGEPPAPAAGEVAAPNGPAVENGDVAPPGWLANMEEPSPVGCGAKPGFCGANGLGAPPKDGAAAAPANIDALNGFAAPVACGCRLPAPVGWALNRLAPSPPPKLPDPRLENDGSPIPVGWTLSAPPAAGGDVVPFAQAGAGLVVTPGVETSGKDSRRVAPNEELGLNGLIALPPNPVGCGFKNDTDGAVALELPVAWGEKAENGVVVATDVLVAAVFCAVRGENDDIPPKKFMALLLAGGGEAGFAGNANSDAMFDNDTGGFGFAASAPN